MVAVELGGLDGGLTAKAGTASAVTKAAGNRNMLLLSAGRIPESSQVQFAENGQSLKRLVHVFLLAAKLEGGYRESSCNSMGYDM